MQGKFKRRQYYIDKKFQTAFMFKFCLILIGGACLSIGLTVLTTQGTLTSSFDGGRLAIEKTAYAIMPSVIITNVITTCILGVVVVIVTLLVSHKIAGPIYRFEQDIKRISEGDMKKKISIRNGDQFGTVASNLNEMVQNVNSMLTEVQDQLFSLKEKAEEQEIPQSFIDELEECQRKIDSQFKL